MFGNATRRRNRRRPEGGRKWRIALPKLNWRRWGGIAAAVLSIGGALLLIRFALDQPIDKVAIEGRFQRVSPLDVEKAVRDVSRGQGLVRLDLDTVTLAVRRLRGSTPSRCGAAGLAVSRCSSSSRCRSRAGARRVCSTRAASSSSTTRGTCRSSSRELVGPAGHGRRGHAALSRRAGPARRSGHAALVGAARSARRVGVPARQRRDGATRPPPGGRALRSLHDFRRRGSSRSARVDIDYIDLRYTNGFAVGWRGRTDEEVS